MTQEYLNWLLQLIAENRLREFYLSSEWRTLSERIISEQKECQICKENHRWGPAQIVHHVNYLRNNPELALSRFDRDGNGSPCPSYVEENIVQTYGYSKEKAEEIFGCWNGKVIGEFVCDAVIPISIEYSNPKSRIALKEFPYTCLTDKQIMDYLGNGGKGYGWHISDLKIYDSPKELYEFEKPCPYGEECWKCKYHYDGSLYEPPCCNWEEFEILRPPQSWCYVENFEG